MQLIYQNIDPRSYDVRRLIWGKRIDIVMDNDKVYKAVMVLEVGSTLPVFTINDEFYSVLRLTEVKTITIREDQ